MNMILLKIFPTKGIYGLVGYLFLFEMKWGNLSTSTYLYTVPVLNHDSNTYTSIDDH